MFVLVGVVIVYLLWRILQVQQVRAQVEVANVVAQRAEAVAKTVVERIGTEEQAIRERRLIEYCDDAVRLLGNDENGMRNALANNDKLRWSLVLECLERGKRSRFLNERDYDEIAPQVSCPGPMPQPELICSDVCEPSEGLTYMPPDAKVCPFCGVETKLMNGAELEAKWLARWREEDAAWQLWKKRAPAESAREEAEELARREKDTAEERAEFEDALAAFKAKRSH